MSYFYDPNNPNAQPSQPGQPWPPQQPPPPPAQWSTQPGQWQQPGQSWPPPPPYVPSPPPKKKRRIWLWIVAAIVVIGLCNAVSHATQSNTLQTSATATSNAPIVATIASEARLGSSLSVFDAKFGSRGTGMDDKGGSYNWHTNYGDLDLYVETLESVTFTDTTKNLVPSLLFSVPYSTGKVLSNKAATELALPFLPKDAIHVKDVLIQSSKATGEAIQVSVYTSASLAKNLPATAFVDSNGQQSQTGLITIVFSLSSGDKNQISDVTVQAGDDLPGGYDSSQLTSPPASTPKSAVTAPTMAPKPQPTSPPAPTYNTDPNGGQLVYSPPADFCNNNACVSTFWVDTAGYVVECANGEYSHSGGVRGVCSRDGGVAATLYQHS